MRFRTLLYLVILAMVVGNMSLLAVGAATRSSSETETVTSQIPHSSQGTEPENTAELSALRNEQVGLQQTDPIVPAPTINLRPIGTYTPAGGGEGWAEIAAYDPENQQVFVTRSEGRAVDILDVSDPSTPVLSSTIEIADLDPPYNEGSPNSVAVSNGVVAVALEHSDPQEPGFVAFFDTSGNPLAQVEVGSLPDMLTFTPDGMKVLVANEGEPNDDYTNDPEGSVSIIDLSGGVETLSQTHVTMVGFTQFNQGGPRYSDLESDADVRIFGPGASVAQDLEPEYLTVSDDGETAWVTLQENNALAIINLTGVPTVTQIVSFGFKDHSAEGNGMDASDEDGAINIQTWPVWGMYQPDAIASFTVGGDTYLVTANEGDARDYDTYSEEVRVEDLVLDTGVFSEELQAEDMLGRLNVTTATLALAPIWDWDPDGDGDADALYSFGARSFSIWDAQGNQVYDSGDEFEQITAAMYPHWFNDDGEGDFDSRSDNKGPEPEGATIGQIEVGGEDRTFAFIGLERIGGVMVYEVTDPENPDFVQYVNNRDGGDVAPEGLTFVPAEDSPNGNPLLVVANEVSGTTTIYEITVPDEATTLTLLHNNDGESSLTPFTYGVEPGAGYPNTERVELLTGGVSAFKSLMDAQIAEARMDGHSVVSVYAGDAFLASPTQLCSEKGTKSKTRYDAMAQKYMPYDAHILGNHEFDLGPAALADFIKAFAINGKLLQPFLSANLDFSAEASFADLTMDSADPNLDGLVFTPVTNGKVVGRSAIVVDQVTGQRFGIVGLTTPTLATISSPGSNIVVEQDIETIAQNEIDRLYDDYDVRKIIFVSHLQNVDNDRDLIEQLQQVDLAVAGGGDEMLISSSVPTMTQMLPGELAGVDGPYPIEVEDPDGRTVYIVTTAGNYKYLGRIDVEFDSAGEITSIMADMSYPRRVIPDSAENASAIAALELTDAVAPDATIESEVVAPLEACFDSYPPIVRSEVLLNVSHSGGAYGEFGGGVRTVETNAGNLVADSFLDAYQKLAEDHDLPPYDVTVVAFQNGGGIRQNVGDVLPVGGQVPGPISRLHTGAVLAFSNNVAVVTDVTPEEVKSIFERSVASLPKAGGQFLQVAGLWVRYDLDGTAQAIENDGTVTTPGSRIVSILLDDGTPIVQDGAVVEGPRT
ncbi:MAG: bifunctional metallophosphatase/5'-nucleotidase [Chloroflexaceae bacterium]|nr:bifunctional metallophosphatase/5'-nucleotidase [Chloroflexaceae bacterium]